MPEVEPFMPMPDPPASGEAVPLSDSERDASWPMSRVSSISVNLTKDSSEDEPEVLTESDKLNAVQIGSMYPMVQWMKECLRNNRKILRNICVVACPPDDMYRMMRSMVHRGVQGDTKAAALVMDRVLGRAAEEPEPEEIVDRNRIDPSDFTAEEFQALAKIKRAAIARRKMKEAGGMGDALEEVESDGDDDAG